MNRSPLVRPTPGPTRTQIAIWTVLFAITIAVALWVGAGRSDATTNYCDDSSCTSTVPPTSDVTTTAAPTTTTTVAPSTTTQPPAPSTSTTTTSVAVGPPPAISDDDIVTPPCDQSDGYPRRPDNGCEVDPCIVTWEDGSHTTYEWFYMQPPSGTLYYTGSTTAYAMTCYVPHPSTLPVTGNAPAPIMAIALVVGVAGAVLVAVSRRRSDSTAPDGSAS